MDVPAVSNVLGTLGAVCWSIQVKLESPHRSASLLTKTMQLIPQIVINYRRHHATGLQPSMMMLWAWAGVPLGVYNIVENFNIALRVQPQILTILSMVTWIQCRYYQEGWSVSKSMITLLPVAIAMGGSQAALIVGLRILLVSRQVRWPMYLMATLSAALLAAGVLCHYWDIWTHRTVRGISFLFVGIDAAGDLFSLISIFFQPRLDIPGLAIYGTELCLWLGIFACGGYYNLLPRIRKNRIDRQRRTDPPSRDGGARQAENARNDISLHDMPSSTSVFRTASARADGLRARAAGTGPVADQTGPAGSTFSADP
ncbi:PQ loop repeat protein [Moelleriella libera RCEF 2490]|uniref:PQ loop repeat protein n=1 Tax=Moelleriella libera RCEF 2490 TaxID=1081109 RepID=A0A168ECS1_9HYPO|nr:PQ loop repeat protein [Moelleriella libera RCEF 2490]